MKKLEFGLSQSAKDNLVLQVRTLIIFSSLGICYINSVPFYWSCDTFDFDAAPKLPYPLA